jgi:DNA helicase II / ATP-dependent DNA helicase PcrA
MRREEELIKAGAGTAQDEPKSVTHQRKLREVPYVQVIELVRFLDGETAFASQHSVKGAEFENVLVVLGGGWNHYNWPQLLDLLHTKAVTTRNEKGYYRARNLFYVVLSRPKKRLAVLITQALSQDALKTAAHLFGPQNVHPLAL